MQSGGKIVAVLGDEDTVTGFLLAGVGQRDVAGTNFLAVTSSSCSRRVQRREKERKGLTANRNQGL